MTKSLTLVDCLTKEGVMLPIVGKRDVVVATIRANANEYLDVEIYMLGKGVHTVTILDRPRAIIYIGKERSEEVLEDDGGIETAAPPIPSDPASYHVSLKG